MSKKGYEKNKEFYDKYIRDDRTEDEVMMDIIHENAKKNLNDNLYHKKANRGNSVGKWLQTAVFVTDLVIIGLLITLVVMVWK